MKKIIFIILVVLTTIGFITSWAFIPYPEGLSPLGDILVFSVYSILSVFIWIALVRRLKSKLKKSE
jgi:membrane protein implicated in regulation of membrane protease activity